MENKKTCINGVIYHTEKFSDFSKAYTKLREKEGRILADEEVKRLPKSSKKNTNFTEWLLRQKSTNRFINYLQKKENSLSILDIGCGNGWFSNAMAEVSEKNKVLGLDLNILELEQAFRVFKTENIDFVYGNLFELQQEFKDSFNIITLNACVQYFPDFEKLMSHISLFLKPQGEIHIIDSPFYKPSEIEAAKNRTRQYYESMGASEMSNFYFHHSIEKIKKFELMYSPSKNILKRILSKRDSPFMWLRYKN